MFPPEESGCSHMLAVPDLCLLSITVIYEASRLVIFRHDEEIPRFIMWPNNTTWRLLNFQEQDNKLSPTVDSRSETSHIKSQKKTTNNNNNKKTCHPVYLNCSRSVLWTLDLSSHPELITLRQSCCPWSPNPQIPISPPARLAQSTPCYSLSPSSAHTAATRPHSKLACKHVQDGSTAVQRPSLFPVEEIWRYRLWRGSALSSVELALSLKSSAIILKGLLAMLLSRNDHRV